MWLLADAVEDGVTNVHCQQEQQCSSRDGGLTQQQSKKHVNGLETVLMVTGDND
jgi:hypothetical protein